MKKVKKEIIGILILLVFAISINSATIDSITNYPDPFNSMAVAPLNQDTIFVRLSTSDDVSLGIYDQTGTNLLYRYATQIPSGTDYSFYWNGTKDAIPAYGAIDTFSIGTYLARARTTLTETYYTQIKGTGTVFDDLLDLATDKNGDIYFCDQTKGVIQKIDSLGNLLLKIDLTTTPYNITAVEVKGIAVDEDLNIYFSDKLNDRITKLYSSTNYSTFDLRWNISDISANPQGLCIYGNNLWLADRGNNKVREFDSLGNELSNFKVQTCNDVVVDNNYVYVVETSGTDGIKKHLKSDGSLVDSWNVITGNGVCRCIAIDTTNNYLFTTLYNSDEVVRYNLDGSGEFLIGNGKGGEEGEFRAPFGITVLPGINKVVVADRTDNQIELFEISDGSYYKTFETDSSNIFAPKCVAIGPDGEIFIASLEDDIIKKYTSEGIYITTIGSKGSLDGQISNPWGLVCDDNGDLYVAERGNNRVQKFSKINNTSYTFAWKYTVNNAEGITLGTDNIIYVVSNTNNSIYKINTAGVLIDEITEYDMENNPGGLGGSISDLSYIAIDYANNIYVADNTTGDVVKGTILNSDNNTNSYYWEKVVSTGNNFDGIDVDEMGNIYLSDEDASENIKVYSSNGVLIHSFGGYGIASGKFDNIGDIEFTKDKKSLWIIDAGNDRVQKFNFSYASTKDELITIGDPSGPPSISGLTFAVTNNDSSLSSPIGDNFNTTLGDSGVTVVVTFNENMNTAVSPTVTLKDANLNLHSVSPRNGSTYTNGWVNSSTNTWKGYLNIPINNDGLAIIYVENAQDELGTVQYPNPYQYTSLVLDTENPSPTISSPSHQSSILEASTSIVGNAEAYSIVSAFVYSVATGGSPIYQQNNISANASGIWSVNSMGLNLGDNYIAAISTDVAGNISSETSPRIKITRTNVLPGTIVLSPSNNLYVGDSIRLKFTYTAASLMDNATYIKIGIPQGWSNPQVNTSSTAGFVTAVGGNGTILDAVPVSIINIDTIQVNITSMNNGTTFDLYYGDTSSAGFAKLSSSVICGSNVFATSLNDTINIDPQSLTVITKPVEFYTEDVLADTIVLGANGLLAMNLFVDNSLSLKNKEITNLNFRIENSSGTSVEASSRFSLIQIKNAGILKASAVPGSSSEISILLTNKISVPAGDTTSIQVYVDITTDENYSDSTFKIKIEDSLDISVIEETSGEGVLVRSTANANFPYITTTAVLWSGVTPDSLYVNYNDIMISSSIGELEKDISGFRLILRHPTVGGNNINITRLEFTMSPSIPSNVISKKMLRRKGESTNLYSSTSIESTNPLVFNLSLNPISLSAGSSDTIDVLFDVVETPSSSISFTLNDATKISAKDAVSANSMIIAAETNSFPFISSTGTILSGVTTPSGKDLDADITDWDPVEEKIETSGSEELFITWDNNNLYIAFNGRDLSTDGDLFIYMSSTTSGATSTWDYGAKGRHFFPTNFEGSDYLFYYDDNSSNGLKNGKNNYSTATYTGSVSNSALATEISIPFSNLGDPSSLKIIVYVQKEGTSEILSSMPYDGVGEFVKNPTGLSPQTFISWITIDNFAEGSNPATDIKLDSANIVRPTWSYAFGSGNYVSSLAIGYNKVYVSVGGVSPKLCCVDANSGSLLWEQNFTNTPSNIARYWESAVSKNVLMFSEGNNFHFGWEDGSSYTEKHSPINIGALAGNPLRSISPDGNNNDSVYAYFPADNGRLYKVSSKDGTVEWSISGLNISSKNRIYIEATKVYVASWDGSVRTYDIDGNATGDVYNTGDSIMTRISFASALGTVYLAPKNNNLVALNTNLTLKWNLDLGAITNSSPYYLYGTDPGVLFCPAGKYLRRVDDNVTSASIDWTYETTNTITTDPASLGNVVYFTSQDKRNFAIDMTSGTNLPGWPSAVLAGENKSRIIIDGASNSVYFGGGDGKLYRYPKQ